MLLAVKTVKSDWCVSIRLLLVNSLGLLLVKCLLFVCFFDVVNKSFVCYYQRLTLENWFTNLEQTPLNRCLQLPAPYKRLIDNVKETDNPQTID